MKNIDLLTQKMSKLFPEDKKSVMKEQEEMLTVINEAKKEWEDAKQFYNNVDDPDLIDYAIYAIQAAEKKYTYLYKKAKKKSISD